MTAAWTAGNERAVRRAVARFGPSGAYDRHDLAQEARIAVWLSGADQPALAATVAVRAIVSYLRTHGPRTRTGRDRLHITALDEHADHLRAPGPGPEQQAVSTVTAAELLAWLEQACTRMPPGPALVIRALAAGATAADITAATGYTTSTVHTYTRTARKHLERIGAI